MSSGQFKRRRFLALLSVLCGAAFLPVFSAPPASTAARNATKKTPLKSSVLAAAEYDETKKTLEVEFRSGAVYRYITVPHPTYDSLLAADSKGRYFSQHIRNDFAAERIR